MKDVQCYELFGGIARKNHAFSFSISSLIFGVCFAYVMPMLRKQHVAVLLLVGITHEIFI